MSSRKRRFQFDAGRGEMRFGSKTLKLPRSATARIAVGTSLVCGGILGFLPVLGFWMVPVGLLVLSQDLPSVRRWRRSLVVRMERRKGRPDRGRKGENSRPDGENSRSEP
ncbi:hypothetical protein [Hoeflea sp.]|uniref:hypothetical protein n=1 Tax=Hoeflea sp. TaxID=1940281 RepID=UPI003BB10D22